MAVRSNYRCGRKIGRAALGHGKLMLRALEGRMEFFEWWIGLSRWSRAGMGLACLLIPIVMLFNGVIWPAAWAFGIALLLLALPPPMNRR